MNSITLITLIVINYINASVFFKPCPMFTLIWCFFCQLTNSVNMKFSVNSMLVREFNNLGNGIAKFGKSTSSYNTVS